MVRKPAHLSFAEAATLTIVYLTAYHCLVDLARLEKGERGAESLRNRGIGIAAIRLAQLIGAEVYATAGSETKRHLLRDMGVRRVMTAVRWTSTTTVSSATPMGAASMCGAAELAERQGHCAERQVSVAPFGRFVEIGKTGIYGDTACLYLKRFGDNLSYHAVDVDLADGAEASTGARAVRRGDSAVRGPESFPPPSVQGLRGGRVAGGAHRSGQGPAYGKVVLHGRVAAHRPAPGGAWACGRTGSTW